MSLAFVDSFDHYATADIEEKYQSDTGGSITTNGSGRCGTEAYKNSTVGTPLVKGITNSGEWGLAGAAFKPGALSSQQFIEVQNAGGLNLAFLTTNANGSISLWSGQNQTIGTNEATSAAGLLSVGIWAYIEFRWQLNNGAGQLFGYVNGTLVCSATGLTQSIWDANGPWAGIGFILASSSSFMDDVYIATGGGTIDASAGNLGDSHVEWLGAELDSVGGGGTYAQWTPSSGVDHGAMVDEDPPDDDTTTLSTSGVANRDTVTVPDISLVSGTIHGVQVIVNAKKENTSLGNRSVKLVAVSGATTDDGAEQFLSTDYYFYREVHETDPNTGSAWAVAAVNAMEPGIRLES